MDDPDIEHIQLPFNLLDGRWQRDGVPERLAGRPEITVHARSAFLQGVLLRAPAEWPSFDGLDRQGIRRWLEHRSEEHTSELQSLMRISYAVFCCKNKI